MSNAYAYATTLAGLAETGNAFQAEVCVRLWSVVLGIKTILSKPHGDVDPDRFFHVGTQGYCCYGPAGYLMKSYLDLFRICSKDPLSRRLQATLRRLESPNRALNPTDNADAICSSIVNNVCEPPSASNRFAHN
jgi:hypothetical protein